MVSNSYRYAYKSESCKGRVAQLWKQKAVVCQRPLATASRFPFVWPHDLYNIKYGELWTWKDRSSLYAFEMDPQASPSDLLQGNASLCMETSPINVKQTIIYNTGYELYVILRLISCCCSENFIDFTLQNEPISRQWFSFNSQYKLRNLYLFICIS